MFQKIENRIMLADGAYAFGKKVVTVYLPAVSSLYFGLGHIWNFPSIEQVVGSCAVFATFLGVCLGLSSVQYDASGAAYDGQVIVTTNKTGKKLFSLELDGDPEELEQKDSVTFKVPKGP